MWGSVPQSLGEMDELDRTVRRRTFRWPGAARDLLKAYLTSSDYRSSGPGSKVGLKALITRLAAVSGNPRGACWRFARQAGIKAKRSYRPWTKPEQQKLLNLMSSHSLEEVTLLCDGPRHQSAPCCIAWERARAWARTGSPSMPWPKPCTFEPMRCRNGSIEAGSNAKP